MVRIDLRGMREDVVGNVFEAAEIRAGLSVDNIPDSLGDAGDVSPHQIMPELQKIVIDTMAQNDTAAIREFDSRNVDDWEHGLYSDTT